MIGDGYTLTLGELTDRVGAGSPRQRDVWNRRLRHWATMGVFDAVAIHPGTGNARKFDTEAVYLAKFLLGFADFGLPIAAIKKIAASINHARHRQDNEKLWQAAKSDAELSIGPVFVLMTIDFDEDGNTDDVIADLAYGPGSGITPHVLFEGDTIIIRNLTETFASVKA